MNFSGWFTLIIAILLGFVSPHSAFKQATTWVCYLWFMKLFMKNEDQLKQALAIVKNFSSDIQMTFGLDKCATVNIRNGKVIQSNGIDIDKDTHIRNIDAEETYRYLGIALPVISCSYGVIEWLRSDLQKIDWKTRKLLTLGGAHHPNADIDRLYFNRTDGGRGLLSVENQKRNYRQSNIR